MTQPSLKYSLSVKGFQPLIRGPSLNDSQGYLDETEIIGAGINY